MAITIQIVIADVNINNVNTTAKEMGKVATTEYTNNKLVAAAIRYSTFLLMTIKQALHKKVMWDF
jgi:hypothetical protein